MGFRPFDIVVEIEEIRAGGPVGTTRGEPPKYNIRIYLADGKRWWDHEYEIEQKRDLNVVARWINTVAYDAVKSVYARFNKRKVINKHSSNINVTAKFNDNQMFKKKDDDDNN